MKKSILFLSVLFVFTTSFGQDINQKWLDLINQGKEEYAINNYQNALELFTQASQIIPTDTTAYTYMMDCAYKIQNSQVVYNCFDKLSFLKNENVRSFNMAIFTAVDVDKDYQKAVTYVETAKQKFPDNLEILFSDINIYYKYGDYNAAKEKINALLEKFPKNKKAFELLIFIHHAIEKDYQATLNTLILAQERFPDEVEFMKQEVNIYLETGAIEQAEEKFRNLIQVNPDDPKHYYNLSLIVHNKGEYEESVGLAKKAIELNPKFLDAIYNVGTFYYYRALQYNQALTDMTAYQYAFEGQGKKVEQTAKYFFEEAKPYFEKAVELNPDELGAFENVNTINVLLNNINHNLNIAEPLFITSVTKEDSANFPDLDIIEIWVEYPEVTSSLQKGDSGVIKAVIQNYNNNAAVNCKMAVIQPFINTLLAHETYIAIDSIGPMGKIEVEIPITYMENNAEAIGVEKVEGAKDIVRFFVEGENNYHSGLFQANILLGNRGDVTIDVSETIDIDFTPETRPTNFLLVIGIDNYQNWPALNNAVTDAKSVESVLIDKYEIDKENVFELFDLNATKENMINELIKIKRDLSENDNLIIYYAGHGDYDTDSDEGAWIPVNGEINNTKSYLDNTTLLSFLKALNTKHTFLIADACFSGSLFVSDDEMTYKPNNDKIKSRWGFTSGNLEYVADGVQGEGSPFVKYLIEALEENRREYIAVTELISYVKFKVRNTNAQTPIGRPLKIDGNEGGEFLLYTREKI